MTMPAGTDPLADADELCRKSAAELAQGYRAGTFSPVEVARAVLARSEMVQAAFNAFTLIDHADALAAAAESEVRWRQGQPLSEVDGVPATIKDIVWIKGKAVSYGSKAIDPVVADQDAPSVQNMRAKGLVFTGITTTPEFGWKALTDSPGFGITRNPHDPSLTPGGSSGGAAVAAATGAGVFHLGSDGGGSIRVPSSFTGIVGIKPSFGRVPAYPASPFGTVAHVGPMTRSVADTAAMLAAMSGKDGRDWMQQPGDFPALGGPMPALQGLKIGYWTKPPGLGVDPRIAARLDQVAAGLASAGAELVPFDLPDFPLPDIFRVLWFSGAAQRLAMVPKERHSKIDPGFLEVAAMGAEYRATDFIAASTQRGNFGVAMDAALARFDVLLSPGTAIPAFTAGLEVPEGSGLKRWTEWAGFSYPINLTQQPALVMPCGKTDDGKPIALQIVGPRGDDGKVLGVARAIEASGIL